MKESMKMDSLIEETLSALALSTHGTSEFLMEVLVGPSTTPLIIDALTDRLVVSSLSLRNASLSYVILTRENNSVL